MPIPFIVEDLFEVNDNFEITYNNNWICIDNFYKNYDNIIKLFDSWPVEAWKKIPETRNFKDYYDCRLVINNFRADPIKTRKRLSSFAYHVFDFFNLKKEEYEIHRSLNFNIFKHIKKDIPVTKQHHPHYDSNMINVLTYLDPQSNGGTAIYENIKIKNDEATNLIIDVSDIKIREVIPAKPNRCVIFNGNDLHGAYINDNNVYTDNWRITQADFFKVKR
jgi:hypothetical protein